MPGPMGDLGGDIGVGMGSGEGSVSSGKAMAGMAIEGTVELFPSGDTDIVGMELPASSILETSIAIDGTLTDWLLGGTGNGDLLRGMTALVSHASAELGKAIV